MTTCEIHFPGTRFSPLQLPRHAPLSRHLDPSNSPVLFGCRAGLCGTCLSRVRVISGTLAGPLSEEAEALDIYGEGQLDLRLVCQIDLTADIAIDAP